MSVPNWVINVVKINCMLYSEQRLTQSKLVSQNRNAVTLSNQLLLLDADMEDKTVPGPLSSLVQVPCCSFRCTMSDLAPVPMLLESPHHTTVCVLSQVFD